MNIFLGPKWGSKTLRIPSNLNVRGGDADIPPVVDKVDMDDSGVKPTDWVAKSEDYTYEEVSETDWVAEPDDSGDEDEDDSDWSDSSQELNSTAKSAQRLVDTHGKIIDLVADSSTKLSAKLPQPTSKPTDTVTRTERTDQSTRQKKITSPKSAVTAEFQDATKRYDARTANSRRTTPKQSAGLEDDSYAIDYGNDYESDFGFGNDDSTKTSSENWVPVDNLTELFDKGALKLNGFGFSGMYKSVTCYFIF